jgi:hypothetical protein
MQHLHHFLTICKYLIYNSGRAPERAGSIKVKDRAAHGAAILQVLPAGVDQ